MRLLCPEPGNFSDAVRLRATELLDADFRSLGQAEFNAAAPDYDAVLVRFNTRVGSEVMHPGSRLRAVMSPTTGLDHLDLRLAKRQGVEVFHLRGQTRFLRTINPTAEMTIALLLALLRKLPQAWASVLEGRWEVAPFRGHEVAGKTLGILGYGRLGSKVARTAIALQMEVLAYDIRRRRLGAGVRRADSMEQVLRGSDIVSVHLPLNEETTGILGPRELALLRPGAILINTARGALVDTGALLAGLRSGAIGGAALDVLTDEHGIVAHGHPLIEYARDHDNILITPHISGASYESVERTDMHVFNRFLEWSGIGS
ncbi:MAG: NAD(P)-dependent oxidoreductase [Pseudomonadota bacterium]|nr:NAD(P)-dependent oxidoreductase [Pseudomonadota bacterium]